MIFSYNWLKEYVSGKLPEPKKLAELLTFHSFEIEEELKKKGSDWLFNIDVLANRAHDCLSHIGIARECAVITGNKLKMPEGAPREDARIKAGDFVEVEVKNRNDCPRYTATVIKSVEIAPSPKWVQERLTACGLQAINNIVDITNYVMLETGQPLHAFDLDKLGKKIIIRRAKRGEKLSALDDKTYQLDKDVLVIADSKKPIALAGIKGGAETGIDKKTKNIVIEAANFDTVLTRLASKKLKLKTDASWRFENGIDPNLIDFAQKRACYLIQKLAGGRVAKGMVDFYPNKIRPAKIQLDLNYMEKLLGLKVPRKRVENIFKNLGFKFQASTSNLQVEVPTRRLDVSLPEDLIEEIGRIYGYRNIPSVFPESALVPPERNDNVFWKRNVQNILKELGFCEAYNGSFYGEKQKLIFSWPERELVEIANPMSSLYKYLRPSLIPGFLKNVKENFRFFDEVKIFELGHIFKSYSGRVTATGGGARQFNRAEKVEEKQMVGGVLAKKGAGDEGFYELKGVVDLLLNQLGVSDVFYDAARPTPEDSYLALWHPGKCAEIKANRKEIGFLGEIHPGICEDLGIKEKVFIFDIDFDRLTQLASEENEYQPISVYPAVLRDLALLVLQGTKVVEVQNVIEAAGGELVKDVDLFDVYSGEGVPEDKENFAFHIIYQVDNRPLSSKEVDKVHQGIIKALEENPDWEVRR